MSDDTLYEAEITDNDEQQKWYQLFMSKHNYSFKVDTFVFYKRCCEYQSTISEHI